jgi:hypothetical protein
MTIEHIGSGQFIDTEPVEDEEEHIYAYASFRSLEHVAFGLFKTKGGPKAVQIDHEEVGEYGMEPLAPYWEFGHALEMFEGQSKWGFEDQPFVEVTSERDYDDALEALDIKQSDGNWEKPGLYDFRDKPPTFFATVEEYEMGEFERAAEDAFDFMFQGDEWKDAYEKLRKA